MIIKNIDFQKLHRFNFDEDFHHTYRYLKSIGDHYSANKLLAYQNGLVQSKISTPFHIGLDQLIFTTNPEFLRIAVESYLSNLPQENTDAKY